jgi:hypothetical protein
MANLTSQEYVLNHGEKCPVCKENEVEGDHVEVGGNTAWQGCWCLNCGSQWVDNYVLTNYDQLEEYLNDPAL